MGVFIDFTISQTGMIRHWLRERPPGFRSRLTVNAVGAVITGLVAIDVAVVKAPASLLVLVLIPILVGIMWFIHHEYDAAEEELEVDRTRVYGKPTKQSRVIIPVPTLSRAVIRSVQFGRSLSDDVTAVHITIDAEAAEEMRKDWEHMLPDVPLVIIETPYRSLVLPFLHYLDVMAPTPPTPSPSWSCPSTCRGTGGTGSCTTRRRTASARRSSAATTPSWPRCPTAACARAGTGTDRTRPRPATGSDRRRRRSIHPRRRFGWRR